MSSSIVITLAAIGGIAWLGFLLVAALRRRGPEEIPSNLAPGMTDDELETRRLENAQKAAVLLSAFLAVSIPLYFLGEQNRQVGFVDEFWEESVARGEALVEEFACFDCHGPNGSGGSAPFVEKRSNVSVTWYAPALDDIFYRYDADAVDFWITFGRGNTPMPPWGLAGGGPMTEHQVQDVVNYLSTIQKPQSEVFAEFDTEILPQERQRLAGARETVEAELLRQRQVLANINRAPRLAPTVSDIAERGRIVFDAAGQGIDTDGDGLSDAAEVELVALGEELVAFLRVIDPITLDPNDPETVEGVDDLTTAAALVERLEDLAGSGEFPILEEPAAVARAAFDGGVVDPAVGISADAVAALAELADGVSGLSLPASVNEATARSFVEDLEAQAEDDDELADAAASARDILEGGLDPDGDGLSTAAEGAISDQVRAANSAVVPSNAAVPNLDPVDPETTGEPDQVHASSVVAGWETLALNLTVTANNIEGIRAVAQQGVAFLEEALAAERWVIDVDGVAAAAFDGDRDRAERAVLLYNGFCARCHTAGYPAGVAFTLEAGSGGFGPALWDGRPVVQFGSAADDPDQDLLVQFLINGSQAETPYGLNGFGSGRMPAFGQILSLEDIQLLAQYLRGGDLTGLGGD